MVTGSANVIVKYVAFFLVICSIEVVKSQEYDDAEVEALEREERAIFRVGRPRNGYAYLRRRIRGYVPPISKRRVISIMVPGKREDFDDELSQNFEKRGVIFVPPGTRPRQRQRIGKRFDYDYYDDAVGKRAVISIMRPGKRFDPLFDEESDEDVEKRGIISVIRPGKGKRSGYNVLSHGLGKRTGYNVVSHGMGKRAYDNEYYDSMIHGLGKRSGYNVITHGMGKRESDVDYYDRVIASGLGQAKRAVISIMRPGKRASYDFDSSEEFEDDKK